MNHKSRTINITNIQSLIEEKVVYQKNEMDNNLPNEENTEHKITDKLSIKTISDNYQIGKVQHDLTLTHKEAKAGCPDNTSACGEEDPGAGLEFLVKRQDPKK